MKKFDKEELFCKKCLIHDKFFKNDSCPECDSSVCILYGNLSFLQKSKARDLFRTMSEK